MNTIKRGKEIICKDCQAHYPEGFSHFCPPWMKELYKRYKEKKIKEVNF